MFAIEAKCLATESLCMGVVMLLMYTSRPLKVSTDEISMCGAIQFGRYQEGH